MSDLEHGRELLEMARADLNALKGMLDSDPSYFSDEIFGFHAQQTAEKSMKARLTVLGIEYPKRHEWFSSISSIMPVKTFPDCPTSSI